MIHEGRVRFLRISNFKVYSGKELEVEVETEWRLIDRLFEFLVLGPPDCPRRLRDSAYITYRPLPVSSDPCRPLKPLIFICPHPEALVLWQHEYWKRRQHRERKRHEKNGEPFPLSAWWFVSVDAREPKRKLLAPDELDEPLASSSHPHGPSSRQKGPRPY